MVSILSLQSLEPLLLELRAEIKPGAVPEIEITTIADTKKCFHMIAGLFADNRWEPCVKHAIILIRILVPDAHSRFLLQL